MVFLEKKVKKGHIYWYATERQLVDGVVRRTWQKYLGTAEKIGSLVSRVALTKTPETF